MPIDYQEQIEAKKRRYQELAAKNAQKAHEQHEAGMEALRQIPFGQPILVGHHSERADRAYRGRAVAKIDKSFETRQTAEYYERKADSVGTAGISSDDPEAITKLKEKLAVMEAKRDQIKDEFKRARAAGKTTQGFMLTNLGANIRATKQRIEQLEKAQTEEARPDVIGPGYILRENKEENRIQFIFEAIPVEEIRQALKRHGFRWSPTNKAWQTFLNNRGRYNASCIVKLLNS